MNEKRDKTRRRKEQNRDGEKEQREETERERYGERGRLIEQLKDEERAVERGGGEEEIWFGK